MAQEAGEAGLWQAAVPYKQSCKEPEFEGEVRDEGVAAEEGEAEAGQEEAEEVNLFLKKYKM